MKYNDIKVKIMRKYSYSICHEEYTHQRIQSVIQIQCSCHEGQKVGYPGICNTFIRYNARYTNQHVEAFFLNIYH